MVQATTDRHNNSTSGDLPMPDITLTQLLLIACGAATGGLLGVAAMQMLVGGRMKTLQARLDKVEKARAQTNDMLMQARRQAEGLQKEVLALRRPVAAPQPMPAAVAPAAVAPQAARPRPPAPATQAAMVQSLSQASVEQSQALARARERTKQLLEEELDRTMVLHRPAGGFPDTQPLSQL
jgi:hypothetical protein